MGALLGGGPCFIFAWSYEFRFSRPSLVLLAGAYSCTACCLFPAAPLAYPSLQARTHARTHARRQELVLMGARSSCATRGRGWRRGRWCARRRRHRCSPAWRAACWGTPTWTPTTRCSSPPAVRPVILPATLPTSILACTPAARYPSCLSTQFFPSAIAMPGTLPVMYG